jgi:hypothetical protein
MSETFPYGSFYKTKQGGFVKTPAGARGRPKYINPAWQIDYDFGVGLYPQFMLTIGSSIYMQMSNNTIWKRDAAGSYSQIKSGLNMAGATITSLGNDNGTLLLDSQHEGRDRIYKLEDDGTLTWEQIKDANETASGYAGLVNNGTYLFWIRGHNWWATDPPPSHWNYTNRFCRKNLPDWYKEVFTSPPADYYSSGDCYLDQRFEDAIITRVKYYTGDGDILTSNAYISGDASSGDNFGVFINRLYSCQLNSSTIWVLPSLASAWSSFETGLGVSLRSCYGYGSYLFISAWSWTDQFVHLIYKWNGLVYEVDSLLNSGTNRNVGYHRFITCGNYIYMCAFNRILKKQIA